MTEYLRYYIGEEEKKKSEEWQLWGKDFDIQDRMSWWNSEGLTG